ncbi:Hypothetical predicted protein [Mytilus galloprovincialis]|uniref:Mitochondria-eating protein C-terminal domain-containing protein n=1 Tax=Mytilus galloprovincialis TaxID=29158 RepID=A0A8B6GRF4_MYTGA|nr:Hypothetical predicted protein [Mytilus galloprovincialis]
MLWPHKNEQQITADDIILLHSCSGLALNNEEQASLGKECEDLKILLQQKQKELNNLKSRFQELADSKETSEFVFKGCQELEVLNIEQCNKLDFENPKLKNRLHQYEDKFEDIPALKRHMNTVQSDNDELNLKLQEYAAELEGIPSLKRRIENLQTDNTELEKRDKHKDGLLQKSESTVQKMQKDNQKLQTEIISQNQNYDTLKIKLESLKDKNLELDERLRRRSPVVVAEPKNCQNCFKYRNDISDLKREINDLRDRLSEAAGNKLRDNNPNIADLSDMNRPTSLAEKFSSLYTDEYTDAMEVIEDDMDEAASVKVMLDWLKSCYDWCQRLAKEQRETLINRSIGFMQEHGGQKVVLSDRCLIFVKEFQKKIAVESLAVVGQICHVKSVTQQTLSRENYIVKYIKKCSELCWMMQISDPPLYVNFDVNSGENLNKNDYNVFTKSGSKIDYLVWPVLYLHKTGPMLAKGVAQGK